jgi:hypothetical protein
LIDVHIVILFNAPGERLGLAAMTAWPGTTSVPARTALSAPGSAGQAQAAAARSAGRLRGRAMDTLVADLRLTCVDKLLTLCYSY